MYSKASRTLSLDYRFLKGNMVLMRKNHMEKKWTVKFKPGLYGCLGNKGYFQCQWT